MAYTGPCPNLLKRLNKRVLLHASLYVLFSLKTGIDTHNRKIAQLCRFGILPFDYRRRTPDFQEVSLMKYMCLICAETVMEQMSDADAERHFQEYAEFTAGIRSSGHFRGANRLKPAASATTIRVRSGKVL